MRGPMRAATRPPPTPNTPNATRVTTVMAADRRLAGGRRYVQSIAATPTAARAARPVPRTASRGYGTARRPGLDGLSVLLAGKVAAHSADRLSQRQDHHSCRGHAGTRHRHYLGCRYFDLGRQPD